MPLTEQIINESVERYWREYDRYVKLTDFVADVCREIIEAKLTAQPFQVERKTRNDFAEASQVPAR